MKPADIDAIGRDIFGDRWQAPMARALDVTSRTVRRWASGESPIPDSVPPRLAIWLEREAARLAEIRRAVLTPADFSAM